MSTSQARRMREFLEELCVCVAQKRALPRWSWMAAAVPVAAGFAVTGAIAGCSGDEESSTQGAEQCTDGKDNDGDGLIDCGDDDCRMQLGVCPGPEYGAPPDYYAPDTQPTPEQCNDKQDNDLDGKTDCMDPDCIDKFPCASGPEYGGPFEPQPDAPTEICDDKLDNDGDGATDCMDPECMGTAACPGAEYGGPFEWNCEDNKDNDGDQLTDCADPDCASSMPCGADYAAPFDAGQD